MTDEAKARQIAHLRKGAPMVEPGDYVIQKSLTLPGRMWVWLDSTDEGGKRGNRSAALRVILKRYRAMMEIAHLRKLMRGAVPDAKRANE